MFPELGGCWLSGMEEKGKERVWEFLDGRLKDQLCSWGANPLNSVQSFLQQVWRQLLPPESYTA